MVGIHLSSLITLKKLAMFLLGGGDSFRGTRLYVCMYINEILIQYRLERYYTYARTGPPRCLVKVLIPSSPFPVPQRIGYLTPLPIPTPIYADTPFLFLKYSINASIVHTFNPSSQKPHTHPSSPSSHHPA